VWNSSENNGLNGIFLGWEFSTAIGLCRPYQVIRVLNKPILKLNFNSNDLQIQERPIKELIDRN
jgi:hypothetical protein